ncbi:ATP-binding protein [Coraliomargarita sp. SDUM461004]|uniref:histidine kinase n=1 Tax=Thalassobacterium sedimentorum TaxID=3041258 RepID=A0ABU1AKD4_9BACT|nr:ATP-binding protein [Coraliomargarita sp. SDUM461004]MDQ8195209.1 ATP-binding protein [Coraliomargarita sp. SDUM461004]
MNQHPNLSGTPEDTALKDALARLDLALKASDLGIHEYNISTGEVKMDARAKEILTLRQEEPFTIEGFWALLHPDDLEMVQEKVANALKPNASQHYQTEYRICPRDGSSERIIFATGVVVFSERNAVPIAQKLVGTVEDVTLDHLKEVELRQAKERAEAANRAKTAFLADMSHDIRTPLTAINGYTELLAGMLSGEPLEIVEEMRAAGAHLLRTLNSVLKFAKMEGVREEPEIVDVDISAELHNVASMFSHKAQKKSMQLNVDTLQSLYVRADRSALGRILTNLLDNAIKFSPENSTVLLRAEKNAQRQIQISVTDNGRGISQEFQARIFQPFSQEREKLDTALGGSGLGLGICRQLALAMGGDIHLSSTLGKGSCFTVILPAASVAPAQRTQAPHKNKIPSDTKTSIPRVLACDDYPNTRRILEISLRGYELDLAADEQELFDKLNGQEVILLDINLNGQDVGEELLAKLRQTETGRKAKIYAFTAHALPGQHDHFLQQGFDGYLEKPFTQQRLFEVLGLTEADPTSAPPC